MKWRNQHLHSQRHLAIIIMIINSFLKRKKKRKQYHFRLVIPLSLCVRKRRKQIGGQKGEAFFFVFVLFVGLVIGSVVERDKGIIRYGHRHR